MNIILRLLSLWWGGVVWGGKHSPYCVQPNNSVEVVLCCVDVGVVTTLAEIDW